MSSLIHPGKTPMQMELIRRHSLRRFLPFAPYLLVGILATGGFLHDTDASDSYEITWTPGSGEGIVQAQVTPVKYGKSFAYSIEIDDAPLVTATVVAPLLSTKYYTDAPPGVTGGNARAFVGSAAVFLYRVEGNSTYVSWSQLQQLKAAGWDIVNHSYWHSSGNTEAKYRQELYWSQSLFAAIIGNGRAPTHMVYPTGDLGYKPYMADYGLSSGSLAGYWRNYTLSPGFVPLNLDRNNLDEGAWTGGTMAGFPAPPSAGEIVIDFTHGINADTTSANYQRWQQRLLTISSTYGREGNDSMWCAPTGEIMEYVRAAKAAQLQVQSGKVTVTLPTGTNGSPVTVKLDNVSAESQFVAPPGGVVYRQGTSVWVTTPLIGTKGAAPPVALKKVYDGPVQSTVSLGQSCKLACVRIHQSGGTPGALQINSIAPGGQAQPFATDTLATNFGVWLLYFKLPDAPAPDANTITLSAAGGFSGLLSMEVWAVNESSAANTGPVVDPGSDQSIILNEASTPADVAGSLLSYSFDQSSGPVSNQGSVGSSGNLTLSGNATLSAEATGITSSTGDRSLLLNGNSAPVAQAKTPGTVPALDGQSAITITGWIKTSNWTTDRYILLQQDGTWTGGGLTLTTAAGGNLRLNVSGNMGNAPMVSTGGTFAGNLGGWTFFAVSWDGTGSSAGKVKYYSGTPTVPAMLDSAVNRGTVTSTGTSAANVLFGAVNWYGAFTCALDNVRIYNTALGAAQIEQIRLANTGATAAQATATLSGTVSDDGLPTGALTCTWSLLSGPGSVSFANANSLATTASFSKAGTYLLRLTGSDGALSSTGDVTIIVASPGTIQAWRTTQFGANAMSPAVSGDSVDLDGDGFANLVEYALSGNPTVASRSIAPVVSLPQDHLEMTLTRLATTDVTYIVEASSDLVDWTPIATLSTNSSTWTGSATVMESGTGTTRQVSVVDSTPISAETKRFLRLRVTNP